MKLGRLWSLWTVYVKHLRKESKFWFCVPKIAWHEWENNDRIFFGWTLQDLNECDCCYNVLQRWSTVYIVLSIKKNKITLCVFFFKLTKNRKGIIMVNSKNKQTKKKNGRKEGKMKQVINGRSEVLEEMYSSSRVLWGAGLCLDYLWEN